jgi:prepilin-type N-terminal cleavage/methylation domain-containing protein
MKTPVETKSRKGFTLIELTIVIAIIGIMSAVAFLSILHYRMVIRVNSSARDVAGQIRQARAMAIHDDAPVLVYFYPGGAGGDSYMVAKDNDEDKDNGFTSGKTYKLEENIVFGVYPTMQNVPGHKSPQRNSSCGIDINPGEDCTRSYVYFRRDGGANFQGVVYLAPWDDVKGTGKRDDRQRAVDWEGPTGRIRLWKWSRQTQSWY